MSRPESLPALPDDFSDHEYATKHGVPLWLRIYPAPEDVAPPNVGSSARSWILWIHGGAYCSGQHYQLRTWLLPLLHPLGIHVVSIAHRFMPYVAIEDMMEDCMDAFQWSRINLPSILKNEFDVERCVLGGDSSGGGLAMLLAQRLDPGLVRAVINVYGVTDMVAQQQYLDNQPSSESPWLGGVPKDEIRKTITDHDPSQAVTCTTNFWNLTSLDKSTISKGMDSIVLGLKEVWKVPDEEWVYDERVKRQWDIKHFVKDHDLMVKLALRLEPDTPEVERMARMEAYSTKYLLAKTPDHSFPPTVFLHGTGDTNVPIDISRDLAGELRKISTDVEELYCEGENHGWDNIYVDRSVEGWNEFIEPIGRFVQRHLGS